ncbi:MAG: hypothetical protein WBA23_19175, partial [Tunicatimonas sp.]|uniref:hypothetical protein n=1 Tax=Tunicatimonas sp. TaxID=1940096 RepID=UPI003C756398
LGDAEVPTAVTAASHTQVQQAFRQAFVAMFNQLMYISTGLSWVSAIIAFFLIDKNRKAAS